MLKSSVSRHWNGWNSEGCAAGYRDGIVRVLPIFGYTFCSAPFLWASLLRMMDSLQTMLERDPFFPRLGEPTQDTEFSKLY